MTTVDKNSFVKQPQCAATRRAVTGLIKQTPADFVVEEVMGFEFSGNGEHVMLQIEKQGLNTLDVVSAISHVAGSPKRDIGFCGYKDKQAITTQWFSVRIPQRTQPAWSRLENEQIAILSVNRHCKKLRRGVHLGNRFHIKVRQLGGNMAALAKDLDNIKVAGVPNYFGPQRFSHSNLQKADALFEGRLKWIARAERGILLSSVRSAMFNDVLSHRVRSGTWNKLLEGDAANLNGTNSYFQIREVTEELQSRLKQFDIHPSGPLFGAGKNPVSHGIYQLESEVLGRYPDWCACLLKFGLRLQRRALRLQVSEFHWEISSNKLLALSFSLKRGGFATSVLNEFLDYTSASEFEQRPGKQL